MSRSRLEACALHLGSVMPRTKPPTARATGHRRGTLLTAEVRPLVAIGTGALVVACLYWGQGVLIPVALAGLLAFLLSPVVNAIDRWGAGRATSVLAVVLLAFCLVGGVGWVLLRQLVSLADELPAVQRQYPAAHGGPARF